MRSSTDRQLKWRPNARRPDRALCSREEFLDPFSIRAFLDKKFLDTLFVFGNYCLIIN